MRKPHRGECGFLTCYRYAPAANPHNTLVKTGSEFLNSLPTQKDKMSVIDGEFMRAYASQDEDTEAAAQLSNPWATDKFNHERERLFFYAFKLHKEFIASFDCMLGNLRNLPVAWGIGGTRMALRGNGNGQQKSLCKGAGGCCIKAA